MDSQHQKVVAASMKKRKMQEWTGNITRKQNKQKKLLLKNASLLAAVSFCLCAGIYMGLNNRHSIQSAMSFLTAGFEYDETLGRLQFVSNILPESAMVFLNSSESVIYAEAAVSADAILEHNWTPEEPWFEYMHIGNVSACSSGEVMTIIKNRENEYTVRLLHDNGCESIYSGMHTVHLKEHDSVLTGQTIGTTSGFTAFEFRKDGMSVHPFGVEMH